MNLIERVKRHMYTHMYQNGNYSSTKMPLVLGWFRAEWWDIVQQVEKFVLNTKMVSTSYQPNRIFTGTMYAGRECYTEASTISKSANLMSSC